MPNDRKSVVEEARSWLGTPWQHQGRTKNGIDCAGLVVKVAHALGLSEFDRTDYVRNTRGQEFVNVFREHLDEVPLLQLQAGDVVLFRDQMFPCHSAIVSEKYGQQYIIHADARHRKVLEEPLDAHWRSKWIAGFKFRGIE
jgi:cell wall-associated NlpC family hydrolase